jgi:hypothetical protein
MNYSKKMTLELKANGIEWVKHMLKGQKTETKPGSISYLLFGAKPSEQSLNIKINVQTRFS